ncbi:MAG: transcriptional regulator NrdR [Chloroflexota bacterium]|nr:MAG: transcriptional regulator NrdR [Chloroflexota bacterium]
MRCPFCGHNDSRVVDSRDIEAGESIRRRRECPSCGQRFRTYERVTLSLQVVKRGGRREEFDRQKLITNMWKACEKRDLSVEAIEAVARDIENRVHRLGAPEVRSTVIGEYAMEALRELDQIAYIRFASVYKSFADIEDMRVEMERLTTGPSLEQHVG